MDFEISLIKDEPEWIEAVIVNENTRVGELVCVTPVK